jgi:hypothetical protein
MLRKLLVCGVMLALVSLPAKAEDKKDDKPALSGAWVLKGGEAKIEFTDKDVLKISPHGESAVLVIVCEYTVGKDGAVKAKITALEGKEEAKAKAKEIVPVGLEFRFTWKAKDDTATLGEVKGEKVDAIKSHLEGDYAKK